MTHSRDSVVQECCLVACGTGRDALALCHRLAHVCRRPFVTRPAQEKPGLCIGPRPAQALEEPACRSHRARIGGARGVALGRAQARAGTRRPRRPRSGASAASGAECGTPSSVGSPQLWTPSIEVVGCHVPGRCDGTGPSAADASTGLEVRFSGCEGAYCGVLAPCRCNLGAS